MDQHERKRGEGGGSKRRGRSASEHGAVSGALRRCNGLFAFLEFLQLSGFDLS